MTWMSLGELRTRLLAMGSPEGRQAAHHIATLERAQANIAERIGRLERGAYRGRLNQVDQHVVNILEDVARSLSGEETGQ